MVALGLGSTVDHQSDRLTSVFQGTGIARVRSHDRARQNSRFHARPASPVPSGATLIIYDPNDPLRILKIPVRQYVLILVSQHFACRSFSCLNDYLSCREQDPRHVLLVLVINGMLVSYHKTNFSFEDAHAGRNSLQMPSGFSVCEELNGSSLSFASRAFLSKLTALTLLTWQGLSACIKPRKQLSLALRF